MEGGVESKGESMGETHLSANPIGSTRCVLCFCLIGFSSTAGSWARAWSRAGLWGRAGGSGSSLCRGTCGGLGLGALH